mmetsp:Transcript_19727/g.57582  ORF Transcript_19727/g.57582 Transcript_19727/m.57582 type:complete len:212 (-) Transcript_19727:1011-1646(-)
MLPCVARISSVSDLEATRRLRPWESVEAGSLTTSCRRSSWAPAGATCLSSPPVSASLPSLRLEGPRRTAVCGRCSGKLLPRRSRLMRANLSLSCSRRSTPLPPPRLPDSPDVPLSPAFFSLVRGRCLCTRAWASRTSVRVSSGCAIPMWASCSSMRPRAVSSRVKRIGSELFSGSPSIPTALRTSPQNMRPPSSLISTRRAPRYEWVRDLL